MVLVATAMFLAIYDQLVNPVHETQTLEIQAGMLDWTWIEKPVERIAEATKQVTAKLATSMRKESGLSSFHCDARCWHIQPLRNSQASL